MEHCLFDRLSFLEMLDHYPLEQLRSDMPIPYTFWIHDNYGTSCTYAQARCLAALHASWPEEQSLPLQQRGE